MELDYDEVSTKMSRERMLEQVFPTQEKYCAVTSDILDLFVEKSKRIDGRQELEVSSVVSKLEDRGHNRHTVYKVLNDFLVPMGLVNWSKFEGSLQLSKRFANAMRNFSISWKNFVEAVEEGEAE
ncbi:MAG: hypothetical protein MUP58_02115 [Candidatus Nanohaloarchaeota archaeon QJJ-9]|nr:hypothetical protein [Candidatus Nanohaloarchaeota archaeon QJJ-9]